jgi:hypothetical protein
MTMAMSTTMKPIASATREPAWWPMPAPSSAPTIAAAQSALRQPVERSAARTRRARIAPTVSIGGTRPS